ncbi:Protein DegV [subsurface metagenome]
MAKVGIITDTIACLPRELVEEYGIVLVPINIIFEDRVYQDDVDITPSEVYRLLKEGKIPTTSAPSPGVYLEAFRELSQRVESIVCITIAAELTMVHQSATQAREMAKEELPHTPVEVIDSRTAAGSQGLITLAAARAAAAGQSLDEVIKVTRDMIPRAHFLAVIDTLTYLAKHGRVPAIAAWAGSRLQIKPLLTVSNGKARPITVVRTKRRGMERLLEIMRQRTGANSPIHVIVLHANVLEEAESLKQRISQEFNCVEIYVKDFTPVMGVHTGPGLIGAAFYADD